MFLPRICVLVTCMLHVFHISLGEIGLIRFKIFRRVLHLPVLKENRLSRIRDVIVNIGIGRADIGSYQRRVQIAKIMSDAEDLSPEEALLKAHRKERKELQVFKG